MNASGEGERFGRLARPPVRTTDHRENQTTKWGSSKTRFPHWPEARTMGPMAKSLSHHHGKEVSSKEW